jgi:hypothetical protein
MSELKFQTIEHDDDPRRCQGQHQHGQCRNVAVQGHERCPLHIGRALQNENKQKVRNYNLAAYQARLDELVEAPQIMSLREEIAILRMMLERRLNGCKTEVELMGSANAVGDLIAKIEKVLTSCHRVEASTGLLLDKPTALAMGNRIIEVIATYIEDRDLLDRIAGEIVHVIVEQKPLPKVQ